MFAQLSHDWDTIVEVGTQHHQSIGVEDDCLVYWKDERHSYSNGQRYEQQVDKLTALACHLGYDESALQQRKNYNVWCLGKRHLLTNYLCLPVSIPNSLSLFTTYNDVIFMQYLLQYWRIWHPWRKEVFAVPSPIFLTVRGRPRLCRGGPSE